MAMAMAMAKISSIRAATVVCPRSPLSQRRTKVKYMKGLTLLHGFKAHDNKLISLGLPVSNDKAFFAKIFNSLKKPSKGSYGGALCATCSAVAEIFRIAAIMNALVLIGVAVGFVLLRIEASVEEE